MNDYLNDYLNTWFNQYGDTLKQELLKYIANPKTTDNRNRMGCSENWYDPFYAVSQTFSIEEIQNMSYAEISNLFRLAISIEDGLY